MALAEDDPMETPIAALIEGARTFRQAEYLGRRDVMPRLAAAQHPDVMMIGCADSRVDPATICGAGPGDVFVVRNIANLVPAHDARDGRGDSVRAALEYGVKALGVSHVVVLGHSDCGGIKALIDAACGAPPKFEFIGSWLEIAGGVCDEVLAELSTEGERRPTADELRVRTALVERRSVLNSIENLRSYPWVRERIAAGTLTLHGWWFDLHDGRLWTAHSQTGTFEPVETA